MSDPRGFLKHERARPPAREMRARVEDFRELYGRLPAASLATESARCMDCGVPFCQSPTGCPVENLIPEWNDLVHQGRWREALESLHSTNNFPEFTGRLCPAPCESACVLGISSDPVAIRAIEWDIVDRGFDEGWVKPVRASRVSGKRVAIVGSGPAGLAAAQELARQGHAVTVFEKADRVGGLLRYGIPDFKMEKQVLDRRLAQLSAEGVEFRVGCEVGRDLGVADLRASYAAICLTTGAEQGREVPVPGRELPGVHWAMDFLRQQNRRVAGLPTARAAAPELLATGKRVVILGGGDTGSDCLGTAHRQGAAHVTQLELMPRPGDERDASTPWPLWPLKLRTSHAHEEGGARDWAVSTEAFLGDGEGKLRALRLVRVTWRGDGRGFEKLPGTEQELPADLALLATGFTGPVRGGLLTELGVALDGAGRIEAREDFATSVPGIFTAGDARRGASLIVWAIAEGRRMARAIDLFLNSL